MTRYRLMRGDGDFFRRGGDGSVMEFDSYEEAERTRVYAENDYGVEGLTVVDAGGALRHPTKGQLEVLSDVFGNTERPDKVILSLNPVTKTVAILYMSLESEWFDELTRSGEI